MDFGVTITGGVSPWQIFQQNESGTARIRVFGNCRRVHLSQELPLQFSPVSSGKVTAAQVAQFVFDAIANRQFYVYSHPKSLASVQVRLEDIMTPRNPTDPFAHKPELGDALRAQLRAVD